MNAENLLKDNLCDTLIDNIIKIHKRKSPPSNAKYLPILKKTNEILDTEDKTMRPHDKKERPGGVIHLKHNIPTIIVPDLHARIDFLVNLLGYCDNSGNSVLQKLAFNQIQIVCVGDGFHSEINTKDRWKAAYEEFVDGFKKHRNMDKEMNLSLGLMEIVQFLKISFPQNFHFLKGNHENITNENSGGNIPFRKYAYESMMVYEYIKKYYSKEFIDLFHSFEQKMPLLAIGRNFLISHAEPKSFYNLSVTTNYREHPEVVKGLTWTADGEAEEGSVKKMLSHYLDSKISVDAYYFGGHRIIKELYKLRADGKYVQIHNPRKFIIARIKNSGKINPAGDVFELDNRMNEKFDIKTLKSYFI